MAAKVPIISKQYLLDVPLPTHGGRYAVISHASIMQYIEDKIAQNGLVIQDQIFKAAQFGQVASGVYHIKHEQDEEIGLMVSFVNSYNKLIRFGCTVGGYNKIHHNYFIAKSVATWTRKHTGTADAEAQQHISDQIDMIATYYNNIIKSRDIMRNNPLIPQLRASILGYIYFEKGLLTVEQAAQVKRNISSSLLDYPSENLWQLYNHITMVLKSSHPRDWISCQGEVHDILLNMYASNLSAKVNNDDEDIPGQLDMFNEPDHLGAVVSGLTETEKDELNDAIEESGFINNPNTFTAPEPESYDL